MAEKYVKLLRSQVKKLDAEDFDLEAWKSSTVSLLTRIFGEDDGKVKEIFHLKIDYGSWVLRDAKASYKPLESCKRKGLEILEASIIELENFGLPVGRKIVMMDSLIPILEGELKVSEYRAVQKILEGKNNNEEKIKLLKKKLQSLGKDLPANILARYIVQAGIKI